MKNYEYVDTSIGTIGDGQAESFHGGGKTHPGAVVPFGMVQMSPDTVTAGDDGTGYNYCHKTIEGFSINHMSGIGWYGDLGNLQVMPVVGETDLRSGTNAEVPFTKGTLGWRSEFSHETEITKAGYYSVILERYGVKAEATADVHTGMLRFNYGEGSEARLIMNFSRRIAGHADSQRVEVINSRRIEGSIVCTPAGGGFGRGGGNISYRLYFVTEFSHPFSQIRFFENEEYFISDAVSTEGTDLGAMLDFGRLTAPLTVKTAISYVDMDGARLNFDSEITDGDFDGARSRADAAWERALSVAEVEGGCEDDTVLFYTCLYHTLLDPRTAADVDGRYVIAESVKRSSHSHRTMFSGWDVYRSEFPLLTLISPKTVSDEASTLLEIALERGTSFPRWELMGIDSKCMVGDPGAIVIADAVTKGITDFDVNRAYELARASAFAEKNFEGLPFSSLHSDSEQYQKDAYWPGCLSITLENLLFSYAMYKYALILGKTEDAEYFLARAKRYAENYDSGLGYMNTREGDGSFRKVDGRYSTSGCVESNVFQQGWFVPYDVEGLFEVFGKERAVSLLEELFEKADLSALWNEDYNHSNEPCHNLTHYFAAVGLPHRTQYWTRRVQKESYRRGAFGFCGNEDVGQLSAWYVLSAMGFAQICPTKEEFYINTPLFKKITLTLDPVYHGCKVSGTLETVTDKDPNEYPYIKGVKLNGEEITRPYLTWSELTNGGKIEFYLSKAPVK